MELNRIAAGNYTSTNGEWLVVRRFRTSNSEWNIYRYENGQETLWGAAPTLRDARAIVEAAA